VFLCVCLSVCLSVYLSVCVCLSLQAEDNQRKADHLYELKMRELDQRACELQHADEECRRAINDATKNYNLAQVHFFITTLSLSFSLSLRVRYRSEG